MSFGASQRGVIGTDDAPGGDVHAISRLERQMCQVVYYAGDSIWSQWNLNLGRDSEPRLYMGL